MQAAPQTPHNPAPIGLVLDGEMRGDPSDLIALATAFGLSALQEPEAEILTFSLTGSSRVGAAYTEAVARFYTTAALRNYPERFRRYRGLAIGLDDSGDIAASQPSLAETLARKDSGGKPLYPQQVHEFTDTADPVALMRNALTAQDDQSCAVVLNGPATNLARLLGLRGGPELISSKVKRLVAALGNLPSPAPDNHLMADVAAARKLFAEWPTPITAVGAALGEKVGFPGEQLIAGFDWTENHPIVDAFREYVEPPRDISTRESAAVLHAVRPESGYFAESQAGIITVGEDGSLGFKTATDGRHAYLMFDESQAGRLREIYPELVSARPAARKLPDFLQRRLEREKQEELKKQQEQQQP